ncbi:hypothetical protein KBC59_00910 [Patescibacteria group bacterium]|nr:hypothetical protein [Patescibacteria group bacterium]
MNRNRPVRFFLSAIRLTTALFLVGTIFSTSVAQAACCKCVKTGDAGKNICLTGEATTCGELLSSTTNSALEGVTCEPTTLTDAQCQTIASGGSGVCSAPPVSAQSYGANTGSSSSTGGTAAPSDDDIFPPKLNVPIPGLTFASRVVVDGGEAVIPFFAQYVSAAYRYLLGIVLLAASIAVVYGGFHYILGTTLSSIERGKEIIRDAIIGLVMVLSAHVILITLNPALVDFKGLKVAVIAQKSYTDLVEERKRVMAAATVPGQPSGPGVEVPVYVEGPGGKVAPEVPPDPKVPPVEPGKPAPGTVVQDANGVFVAQGRCPDVMVPIRATDEYQKKTGKIVPSFCMDIFEAPNQQGVKPFQLVSQFEADWYCAAQGKRLCADSEWTRACLGPKGENTYQYGPTMINGVYARIPDKYSVEKTANPPAPCNYDNNPSAATPFSILEVQGKAAGALIASSGAVTKPENSFLAAGGSALLKSTNSKTAQNAKTTQEMMERARTATALQPSGARPGCFTPEGVADLSGNAQEIMLTDSGAQKTVEQRTSNTASSVGLDYIWGNFFYFPIAHIANKNADPKCQQRWGGGSHHNVIERVPENSFRCCMPLNENP